VATDEKHKTHDNVSHVTRRQSRDADDSHVTQTVASSKTVTLTICRTTWLQMLSVYKHSALTELVLPPGECQWCMRLHIILTSSHLSVGLQRDPWPEVIQHQSLVRLCYSELPWQTGVFDACPAARACAAVVTRDRYVLSLRLQPHTRPRPLPSAGARCVSMATASAHTECQLNTQSQTVSQLTISSFDNLTPCRFERRQRLMYVSWCNKITISNLQCYGLTRFVIN